MSDLVPTESLIRFLHATPEQRQAIDRFLLGIPGNPVESFRPAPGIQLSPLPRRPRYSLRKDCGVWHLVFDGKEAYIKHERGLFYVVWLLYNPPEHPIHALDLMTKIPEIYRQQLGLSHTLDPATGRSVTILSGARIQERSLTLDRAQEMRALYRKQQELESLLDSEDATEPEKAEAIRELQAIAEAQHTYFAHSKDAAHRAVDSVRKSLRRLHHRLAESCDAQGNPHPVLRPFSLHIQKHLLSPSANQHLNGRLTYEPPEGIVWAS
jgi:hypothetical protein